MGDLNQALDLAWDGVGLGLQLDETGTEFKTLTGLPALEQALAIRVRELLFQFGLVNAGWPQIKGALPQLLLALELAEDWIAVGGVSAVVERGEVTISAKAKGTNGPGVAATFKILA